MGSRWGRSLRAAACVFVAAVAVGLLALTIGQRSAGESLWWIELSRYLPYYWPLVPCVAAFGLSLWLGRVWVLVSAASLLLLFTATMGLQWNSGATGPEQVRLMTYNVKVHGSEVRDGAYPALAVEVAKHDPDILVMQDADDLVSMRTAPALIGGPPVFGLPHVYALGQYVVASRFPLRGCSPADMGFRDESHRYLRCVFDVRGIELTVVTAHFKSPRSGLSATRHEGVDGAGEWRQNFDDRLTQARKVAAGLAGLKRPLVLVGDLNAPESSPVIQTLLKAGLGDAFSAAGKGYGFSYGQSLKRGLSFLRIDHILVSPELGVANCFAGGGDASEHRPVIADLVLRR